MSQPSDNITARVHALVFNGISAASSAATDKRDWIRLTERERIAQAVLDELRAGNIEFRLGPLALLAEAVEPQAARQCQDEWQPPHAAGSRPCMCATCSAAPEPNAAPEEAR